MIKKIAYNKIGLGLLFYAIVVGAAILIPFTMGNYVGLPSSPEIFMEKATTTIQFNAHPIMVSISIWMLGIIELAIMTLILGCIVGICYLIFGEIYQGARYLVKNHKKITKSIADGSIAGLEKTGDWILKKVKHGKGN